MKNINTLLMHGEKFYQLLTETKIAICVQKKQVNSLSASRDFCHLLITFANSSDPDQDGQNFGPDLGPNLLTP